MGLISKLKKVFGLYIKDAIRKRDGTVSGERHASRKSSDKTQRSESDSKTEPIEKSVSEDTESGQIVDSESRISETMDNRHISMESESDDAAEEMNEEANQNTSSAAISVSTSEFAELTGFQRDLLIVVGGLETPKGLEILDELENYYDETVNHGRLYPNLNELVKWGYMEKISLDKRSNGYNLTDVGRALVEGRRHWEAEKVTFLADREPQSSRQEIDGFNFDQNDGDEQRSTQNLGGVSDIQEGQRLEELVIKVIEIDNDERPKRDLDLCVEDVGGEQFPFTIWTKHSVRTSWTVGTWYWLHQSRVQVWNNSSGPQRNVSSTKHLAVEELGESFDWNRISTLRQEYDIDPERSPSESEHSSSPSEDQRREESTGSKKPKSDKNGTKGNQEDSDRVNKLLEDLDLE